MNAPHPKFMIESTWNGRIFSSGWKQPKGHVLDVLEPATGSILTRVGNATAEDVRLAAAEAKKAQPTWAATPYEQRAAIMRKAAALLEEHQEELAYWIVRETGGIAPKAGFEIHTVANIIHRAASMVTEPQGLILPSDPGRISMARRVPRGVIGVISPFNFPLILSARAVAPALALGNAVVLKPDPRTVLSGGFVLARIFEEAGLPDGVLQVLPGGADAGEAMCTDSNIAMISFTGSSHVGRRVGELAGKHLKKVQLELGGKNVVIVLEDADLDSAASAIAFGAWFHQGQICMTTGNVLVHEKIAAALTAKLVEKAQHLPVGNPAGGNVALGPVINASQAERIHAIVKDTEKQGAAIAAGGTYEGPFYKPTVLTGVKPGMRAFQEEVFGPVASVVTFKTDDEAVALANDNEYGLSAGVFSASSGRAMAIGNRLNTGLLHINDQTVADEPHIPFGGNGASGNGTRIGGPANWEEFTQWQWVTIKEKPGPYPF
ncbi:MULTISPECIES: benzaldehyde dehydrogenase [unclassified Beijerinckia]|uniref:benzaldehyde dehydrogenase n=1 Tax=unclassified Beijerinckia TaxID=2638183 RepID=UPI0008969237|nr:MULTISPECIES: benzaldehyde dehydrogenase [unclassified Beijerinckia]MDH7796085.1 benzaldehyde dehydrogenase (NAD) [Beijerinckia sp. GAS462]SEC29645.1 benzaldehyde dehydrogenase (NAD+) [Beijerinckia sp. 28-YEA-48]